MTPIEALKKIKQLCSTGSSQLPQDVWDIATEALAYEGKDEKTFTLDQISNAYDAGEAAADYDRKRIERKDLKKHYFDTIHSVTSYKAGEDLEPGGQEYLNRRIKELNEADIEFCKDRWNMDYPELRRHLAREESNKVTFARQELQEVLKLMTKK